MAETRCSYCDGHGPLTREHLWPRALHRRHLEATADKEHGFWIRRLGKEILSEPTIRDVCATCNNVLLSSLDDYICDLFDRTLTYPVDRYQTVLFEFDYHRLKRWLLKICFNSARIHNADDLFAFNPLRPYMLGKSVDLGRSVQLYVEMSYPAEVPLEALKDPNDAPMMYFPTDHRVGHAWFVAPGVGRKMLRAVHIRSYSFFLAFFAPGEKQSAMQEFSRHFLARLENAVLLKASRSSVSLVCNGMNAWESANGARDNIFVYEKD